MTGWRQAVFVRQRRIDVIQRALSKILDEESWSPATPRRLHVGCADASSRGWTMIVSELANFFLERGGAARPRLCRLAAELHCPAYEVDVRNAAATTLFEVDPLGRLRVTGSPVYLVGGLVGSPGADRELTETPGLGVESTVVGFAMLALPDDIHDRIRALPLRGGDPLALADYLGAIAGFPGWTRLDDEATSAGELFYEPPRIVDRAQVRAQDPAERASATPLATAGLTARRTETRGAIARATPRAVAASHDRRGTRPRSAARPRR